MAAADIDDEETLGIQSRWPVLYKVPVHVRRDKEHIYAPVLVPLGPYHHHLHPQSQLVEPLKNEIRDMVCRDANHKMFLLSKICERIDEIRHFYGGADDCSDTELAEMILRDACFLIYCLKKMAADKLEDCVVLRRLGMSRLAFIVRDFFMLENQLPYFVIKMLIPFTCDEFTDESIDAFFHRLVSSMMNGGDSYREEEKPQQGREIAHLLDCCRAVLVGNERGKGEIKEEKPKSKVVNSQFRSVKDLKAKGIHFRPTKSKSHKLTDVEFRSHSLYGMLRLPILLLESKTKVILSNVIAMEMAPGSRTDFAVTSYVKFMKSLIMKAEDVKELREKGILVTTWLADDEEVVKMFRGLETEGSYRKDIFRGVRERIDEHCRSKTKTFKAELLHTYFRSPWTTIALLAAILLLCVNCLNFLLNYHKFSRQQKRS